jgi:hypothetical protein
MRPYFVHLQTALGVGLARRDFKDAHGSLEDAAALRPTQPDDSVAADTRSAGRWCEGTFRDDAPDGMVADATEQVAWASTISWKS